MSEYSPSFVLDGLPILERQFGVTHQQILSHRSGTGGYSQCDRQTHAGNLTAVEK